MVGSGFNGLEFSPDSTQSDKNFFQVFWKSSLLLPLSLSPSPIMSIPSTISRSATRALLRASTRSSASAASRSFSQAATRLPSTSSTSSTLPRLSAFNSTPAASRGIQTLDFAGTKEKVYERADWPLEKLHDYFKNDTFALLGYGSQGHGQGLKWVLNTDWDTRWSC